MLPPQTIDVMDNLRDRVSIYNWIGKQIATVNRSLQVHLNACDECFNPSDRRSIQIFAVPFASSMQLDGFCNINTTPTTILVDVGRVASPDWLACRLRMLMNRPISPTPTGWVDSREQFSKSEVLINVFVVILPPFRVKFRQSFLRIVLCYPKTSWRLPLPLLPYQPIYDG